MEQLWGIGRALAGIAVSMTGTWLVERSKHKRERRKVRDERGLEICHALLKVIDAETADIDDNWDELGLSPDQNYESSAYDMLTDVQLTCPPKIHKAATVLVDACNDWAWQRTKKDILLQRRAEFIALIRKHL